MADWAAAYGAHHRGDDPAGSDAFWARDQGWGLEYGRSVFEYAAHRAGSRTGQVSPWQIAAALPPTALRRALIVRLDRRVPA